MGYNIIYSGSQWGRGGTDYPVLNLSPLPSPLPHTPMQTGRRVSHGRKDTRTLWDPAPLPTHRVCGGGRKSLLLQAQHPKLIPHPELVLTVNTQRVLTYKHSTVLLNSLHLIPTAAVCSHTRLCNVCFPAQELVHFY